MTGEVTWPTMSTLQGFWPGMQVLYGDLRAAGRTMRQFQSVWYDPDTSAHVLAVGGVVLTDCPRDCYPTRRKYGFTPEGYNLLSQTVQGGQKGYPLRPELAESLYYLSTVGEDETWLEYGVDIVHSLQNHTKTVRLFAWQISPSLANHYARFFVRSPRS
jgi:mannosidase alpha-like ER degradation enhancer 2